MTDTRALSTIDYLPAVHRLRDAQQGGPLDALLQVIDEQVRHVSSNVRRMYEDWFIETCQPDLVPYLGELLGGSISANLTESRLATSRNRALGLVYPRREVAEAISLQRRKGTLPVLEELAMTVAKWYSHAEEWYPRVAQFQDVYRLPVSSERPIDPKTTDRDEKLELTLLGFGQTVDVRKMFASGSLEGPFDQGAYFSDLKPARRGFYPKNRDLLRLHICRLNAYRLTRARARCIKSIDINCGDSKVRVYTLDPVGLCRALYVRPEPEASSTDLSKRTNLPIPLTRQMLSKSYDDGAIVGVRAPSPSAAVQNSLESVSDAFYGTGKSLELWLERQVENQWIREFIPSDCVQVADLSLLLEECCNKTCNCDDLDSQQSLFFRQDLIHVDLLDNRSLTWLAQNEQPLAVVDPECGLLAIKYRYPDDPLAPQCLVTFHYGFSADMGGGEYYRERPVALASPVSHLRLRHGYGESRDPFDVERLLESELKRAIEVRSCKPSARRRRVFEVTDSDTYRIKEASITIPTGEDWEIRAANRRSPTIDLECQNCNSALTVRIEPGATVTLERLRIFGGRIVFESAAAKKHAPSVDPERSRCQTKCEPEPDVTRRITFRHCTLVPASDLCANCCKPVASTDIENRIPDSILTIDHCIVPQILLNAPTGVAQRLRIVDSIVDGQRTSNCAICGTESTILRIERSTVYGSTSVREIDFAQDSIFTCPVEVKRRQLGGMRFCYVPPNDVNATPPIWNTPQQFYCVPSQEYERENLASGACSDASDKSRAPKDDNSKGKSDADSRNAWKDIHPSFTSCKYGHAGYGQLRIVENTRAAETPLKSCDCGEQVLTSDCPCRNDQICSPKIRRGGESGSEMGAFHDLYQPQREDNLRRRVEEFTPLPMNTELLFVN